MLCLLHMLRLLGPQGMLRLLGLLRLLRLLGMLCPLGMLRMALGGGEQHGRRPHWLPVRLPGCEGVVSLLLCLLRRRLLRAEGIAPPLRPLLLRLLPLLRAEGVIALLLGSEGVVASALPTGGPSRRGYAHSCSRPGSPLRTNHRIGDPTDAIMDSWASERSICPRSPSTRLRKEA